MEIKKIQLDSTDTSTKPEKTANKTSSLHHIIETTAALLRKNVPKESLHGRVVPRSPTKPKK